MKGLNVEQVVENIYNIAKTKNIKIKDIEFQIGVSTGYLSRLLKPGGTRMSADVLVKLAEVLGVSVDRLLISRQDELNANERKMMAFIDKLCEDTQNANIGWTRITKDKFEYENPVYNEEDANSYILAKCIKSEDRENDYGHFYKMEILAYNSSYIDIYRDYEMSVMGVFEVKISDLYRTVISKVQFAKNLEKITCYELRMIEKKQDDTGYPADRDAAIKEICSAKENTEEMFSKPLKKLYDIVEESNSHVKLDEGISNAIDSYLNPLEQIPF